MAEQLAACALLWYVMRTSMATSTLCLAAASASCRCCSSVCTIGLVTMTCIPRLTHSIAMSKWVSSGVKTMATSPGWKDAIAAL